MPTQPITSLPSSTPSSIADSAQTPTTLRPSSSPRVSPEADTLQRNAVSLSTQQISTPIAHLTPAMVETQLGLRAPVMPTASVPSSEEMGVTQQFVTRSMLQELRERPPCGDYRKSLFAAVQQSDIAESFENAQTLGRVTSTGYRDTNFDVRFERLDTFIHTAFAWRQVLRDFAQQPLCHEYMTKNNEPGDTRAIDQIVGAEQNFKYFVEDSLGFIFDAAQCMTAVLAMRFMPTLTREIDENPTAFSERIFVQMQCHEKALQWPFRAQLAQARLDSPPEDVELSVEGAIGQVVAWRQALQAQLQWLIDSADSLRNQARKQVAAFRTA